jgi:glutamyl-tRNA reductase
MEEQGEVKNIVNLRFTHKEVPITFLERVTFKEPNKILKEIHALDLVRECVILQTCNRVEIYAAVSEKNFKKAVLEIAEYWRQRIGVDQEKFYHALKESCNSEALSHFMKLTSGLESMIVGENQILGQVQGAFEEAKKCDTIGPVLETIFQKAIKTGRKVRFKTRINKGAVSIGSAAVELLEDTFGDSKDKKIIIIGAGETGGLVGKALASRRHTAIFVANRTYERGVRLAKMLGGHAVRFNKVKDLLVEVDIAIVATAAPHYVLTKGLLQKVLDRRKGKKLFIMDLSQPRNVEESVTNLPGVELRNIDDLRGIAETNLKTRQREIEKAEAIVKTELNHLKLMLKQKQAKPLISALLHKAEEIRRKELKKTLKMLGKLDDDQQKVIDNLTLVLIERILYHPIKNLRNAAVNGDVNTISVAQKLFDLNLSRGDKMK